MHFLCCVKSFVLISYHHSSYLRILAQHSGNISYNDTSGHYEILELSCDGYIQWRRKVKRLGRLIEGWVCIEQLLVYVQCANLGGAPAPLAPPSTATDI